MWNIFFSWYFLKIFFFQSDKKVAYFYLYEEILVVLKLLGKTQLGFGGKSMAHKVFLILLVKTWKEVFVLHVVEENVLHLWKQLIRAILSLADSDSRCTAAIKKRAWRSLRRPIKSTKWLMTSFFVQYFMMYKKTPKGWGFPFDFPFKRQIL